MTERLLSDWGVQLDEPAVSNVNEVWFAKRGDEHVIVKRGSVVARRREATALASYRHGSARLLDFDESTATLLVERVLLGDDLVPMAQIDDDRSTTIIAGVMIDLHHDQVRTDPAELPHLNTLTSVFAGEPSGSVAPALIDRASHLFTELAHPSAGDLVLHGDLHHTNVLRDGMGSDDDRWRAIDPHGWIGDPVFDTAALLANPRGVAPRSAGLASSVEEADRRAILARAERRIEIVADITSFDRDRIRAWAFVAAVIAELWMVADYGFVHGAPLALAEELARRV